VIALRWLAAFARFLYKFLVGDDLLVAIVMALTLAASALLVHDHVNAWWLVPPLAVAMTAVSLRRRARATRAGRRSAPRPRQTA
jgi:hypothetical protein